MFKLAVQVLAVLEGSKCDVPESALQEKYPHILKPRGDRDFPSKAICRYVAPGNVRSTYKQLSCHNTSARSLGRVQLSESREITSFGVERLDNPSSAEASIEKEAFRLPDTRFPPPCRGRGGFWGRVFHHQAVWHHSTYAHDGTDGRWNERPGRRGGGHGGPGQLPPSRGQDDEFNPVGHGGPVVSATEDRSSAAPHNFPDFHVARTTSSTSAGTPHTLPLL